MKYKIIFVNLIFCALVLSSCMQRYQSNKILSNESINATIINHSTAPSKDDVIKQINLGIMIIEESIENYIKKNPCNLQQSHQPSCTYTSRLE